LRKLAKANIKASGHKYGTRHILPKVGHQKSRQTTLQIHTQVATNKTTNRRNEVKEITMNGDIFEGKWKQLRGQIQKNWGDLTDNDLDKIKGSRTEFEGLLQERYGYTKERAKTELDTFLKESEKSKV
jgi:uncharacterized protein YjbJ (UPF0337 family)